MFIRHLGDGVGVDAVEVDEPLFWNDFTVLSVKPTSVKPSINRVIGVADGGDDFSYCKGIGQGFKFLEEGNPVCAVVAFGFAHTLPPRTLRRVLNTFRGGVHYLLCILQGRLRAPNTFGFAYRCFGI